jgi:hypothetical protein
MKTRVNIGDCYRDSAIPWSQWRVERIYRDPIGLPHAVVTSLQDPTVTRTIACPTLADRRRFRLIDGLGDLQTVDASYVVGAMALEQSVEAVVDVAA